MERLRKLAENKTKVVLLDELNHVVLDIIGNVCI